MDKANGERSSSNSLSPQRDNERERSRQKKHKVEYYMGPDLHLTKHYYFAVRDQKNIGYGYAAWNFCIAFGRRPAITLIICDSQSQIEELLSFHKVGKKIIKITDHSKQSYFVQIDDAERESLSSSFDIKKGINNMCQGGCGIQLQPYYQHRVPSRFGSLPQIALTFSQNRSTTYNSGGTIISFINHRRDLQRIEEGTGLNFTELKGNISDEDINKQILSSIQFLPPPKPETYSTLKLLPFSQQQIGARIFQLLKGYYTQAEKSRYLDLTGFISYQVKTDVEFNSYKYIWNYLKDTLPQNICDSVKNMTKFKDGKGAIFNIPVQNKYEMDRALRKIKKHSKDTSKFQISLVYELPQIQDTQSQQYKLAQQKKAFAMRNKNELQIFVGGLPMKAQQQDIRAFFLQHNVNPLTIRLMKDRDGRSRGICFVLCEDQEHLKRSLKLDQSKFGQRTIRIHLAEKKQKRRDD